ncbi:MAG TPA: alginate lyase family protein, partial [Verrucomicrobiae bacterium]|nr:alginate lyase family protein [Verrucomicrobiae bacterium]
PLLASLERHARADLKVKPYTVTDKTVVPPSGDKHDYMSQAPYFWPDPKTPTGLPYIRRDGERNPEIKRIPNHGDILTMPEKVKTLALAYYFTGNETYAAKAAQLLRVWFLDPATRMNPNFEFAQAVPGVNNGRGTGLIESRALVDVVDGVGLLAGSKSWTAADDAGLKQWFGQFLQWMQTSKNGRAEAAAKNNHGTYYDIQVVSYALFLGQTNYARQVLLDARQKRIAVQIEPDGRQPLELVRTKAWSYSVANLTGLMSLATLGDDVGVDLWNYQTVDGRGIRKALDYLVPFALGQKKWPYQQLGKWPPQALDPLMTQAAIHYHDPAYARELPRRSRSESDLLLEPSSWDHSDNGD